MTARPERPPLEPKHYLLLVALAGVRGLARLPYRWQMRFGRWLGRRSMRLTQTRNRVIRTNLRLCFPMLAAPQIETLRCAVYESMGMGVVEFAMAWFMPQWRFRAIRFEHHGLEHVEAARAAGRGAVLCTAHFVCCEIASRGLGQRVRGDLVNMEQKDPVFEGWVRRWRSRYVHRELLGRDVRGIVEALRSGRTVSYLPDQDMGGGNVVFVPFFGVPIAALTGPARLTRMAGAVLIPAFYHRLPGDAGYAIHYHPALDTDDAELCARRWYALLEGHVTRFPEQYLWGHRMFKTRPDGEPSPYAESR